MTYGDSDVVHAMTYGDSDVVYGDRGTRYGGMVAVVQFGAKMGPDIPFVAAALRFSGAGAGESSGLQRDRERASGQGPAVRPGQRALQGTSIPMLLRLPYAVSGTDVGCAICHIGHCHSTKSGGAAMHGSYPPTAVLRTVRYCPRLSRLYQ
eukprot:1704509-Rhodomonas_salina.1